ncbi:hypothetical protein HPB48_026764 [Haemaphysalis longicornis]|uniref:Uncharacterized protein n=1 Tax=Haemaphysalis longicornis TaxID=44386 RepID=A0A9J6H1Y3_HAELO|nr:hypothetical protein HPB48_026764 [Haemaphysalis longicornis]
MPCYDPNSDSSSATGLSEDTHQILSFWHHYQSQRNLQGGSDASRNSTAALVSDYLAGIPCSAGSNDSENISERGLSSLSEQGFRQRLPDHPAKWSAVLVLALLVLTAFLVLAAVSLGVYNIEPASNVSETNAQAYIKPPAADSNSPSLMAAPAFGEHLPPQQPLVTTRSSRRTRSETTDTVERLEATTQGEATLVRDEFSTGYGEISKAKIICDSVSYSYCTRSTPKFYYDPWEKVCTASSGSNAALCLRGSNRFPSKMTCERSCALSERPLPGCADVATFASCTRPDYRGSSLWYFNGRRCRLWDFAAGKCPSRADGAVLFRTLRQCERKCSSSARQGMPPRIRRLACTVPVSTRCRPDELKYTYFAVKSASRYRCLPVWAPVWSWRRCLSGANQFSTRASCESVCIRKPQHSPIDYDGAEEQ